jgi:flavin-binding protein dodecin
MKNHVYKILEIVGSSETSIEEAISSAIGHASKTVRNMDWFEVTQTRGHIEDGEDRPLPGNAQDWFYLGRPYCIIKARGMPL